MAKHLRYYGDFATVEGHSVRVAIYQESDTAFTPEEVRFPADSPVLIEFGEKSKEDVVQGSTCTVKLCTSAFQQFEDMYQVGYGDCRVDIYRDGVFYWTGCLDPEFYEVDYESWDGEISFTFSDFAVWDRERFSMGIGFFSLSQILVQAIQATKCVTLARNSDSEVEVMQSFRSMPITTDLLDGSQYHLLAKTYVRTEIFRDDNGEWKTWREVIEGILTPFNICVMQRRGFPWMYDLNGLALMPVEKEIFWSADHQVKSYDVTYNNVVITYDPNAQLNDVMPSEVWKKTIETPASYYALNSLNGAIVGDATVYSYFLDPAPYAMSPDNYAAGYSLWVSSECEADNVTLDWGRAFRIVPRYDGEESEGVVAFWRSERVVAVGGARRQASYEWKDHGVNTINHNGYMKPGLSKLFSSDRMSIPPASSDVELRLRMETFLDCRVNWFEEAAASWGDNVKNFYYVRDAVAGYNAHANILYVPVILHYKPFNGDKEYVFDNSQIFDQPFKIRNFVDTYGVWHEDAGDGKHICWLAYYNVEASDRQDKCALLKWSANRQAINNHNAELSTAMKKREDGQYVNYPIIDGVSRSGEIWIDVCRDGWIVCNGGDHLFDEEHCKQSKIIADRLAFCAVKLPEISIVSRDMFTELGSGEIVYSAAVNELAKEALELDTVCGSYVEKVPAAKGSYYTVDGTPVARVRRAGKEGTVEELLCGTMFSQYADRHVCFEGEYRIEEGNPVLFSERLQEGKKFMCVSSAQNLREDVADGKFIEVTPDIYNKR